MERLRQEVRDFVNERDWSQYHSPKNLAMGLTIEASELMELFLWKSEEQSRELTITELSRLQEEIGDVMIYLLNLADKFGLDPVECALSKLEKNREKYPAHQVRGSARKYTEYQ
jgi:dCTP diphosphatase